MSDGTKARIESELEVKAYIQDLKFALNAFCGRLYADSQGFPVSKEK